MTSHFAESTASVLQKTPDFTFLGVKSGVCFAKH